MKNTLPLVVTLLVGLISWAQVQTPSTVGAQTRTARSSWSEGQRVVLIGEVSSSPKKLAGVQEETKMQAAVGPGKTDYTLHLAGAKLFGDNGRQIEENDLVNRMWVRAEGIVMDDPRRIHVTRLQVIGKDLPSLRRSAFYRPGFEQGYVMAVAGSRQTFPETVGAVFTPGPLLIVGQVSDDTGTLETTRKIQVDAAGNTWTLQVPKEGPVFDMKGEKISVHEIAKGQWVRAHGWQTEDLRMRVARIENIGPAEAYRGSTYFRTAEPMGYVERMPGTGVRFSPVRVTGVITSIDTTNGSFTLRDERGTDRVLYTETVTVYANGKPVDIATLRTGQRVTVHGSDIQF